MKEINQFNYRSIAAQMKAEHEVTVNALLAELDVYKVRVSELEEAISEPSNYLESNKMNTIGRDCIYHQIMKDVLARTPAQSLASIKAQVIYDLFEECSYPSAVGSRWVAIVDFDTAKEYADEIGGGK